jgi:hypothetical protein
VKFPPIRSFCSAIAINASFHLLSRRKQTSKHKPSHCGNIGGSREQAKKQTASSQVSEQRDGALPGYKEGEKEGCKGENGDQQTITQPEEAEYLSACLAPFSAT